jgi:hypothetical protein
MRSAHTILSLLFFSVVILRNGIYAGLKCQNFKNILSCVKFCDIFLIEKIRIEFTNFINIYKKNPSFKFSTSYTEKYYFLSLDQMLVLKLYDIMIRSRCELVANNYLLLWHKLVTQNNWKIKCGKGSREQKKNRLYGIHTVHFSFSHEILLSIHRTLHFKF